MAARLKMLIGFSLAVALAVPLGMANAADPQIIKVGIATGTGPVAALGEGANFGAGYVFDQFNKTNPDFRIEKVGVNIGAYEPTTGLSSVQKAVLVDNVLALNMTGSPVILAAQSFLEQHKVVTFSNGGSTKLLKENNWVQQTSPFWADEVAVSSQAVCEEGKVKTLAILALNGAAGDSAVEAIEETFPKCGVEIVSVQRYSVPVSSLKPQLSAIKLAGPDMIFLAAGGPQENTGIVLQARQLGIDSKLIGFMGSPEKALFDVEAGEGFTFTNFSQADLPQEIKDKAAQIGTAVLFGYHFASILVDAIEGMHKEGTEVTRENLRAHLLKQRKFDTRSGPFCFQEDGHTKISLTMWQVTDGNPVQIKDVPIADCN
jgi:ABC-type branched-subunit amino acid transport system substrate-binding protein